MSVGCPSQNDQIRCVRYKRMFEKLKYITFFDCWNNPPKKLFAHYYDVNEGSDMSNPITIRQRKDGTYYFQFEGKRYDVYMDYKKDVEWQNIVQWFDDNDKNKVLKEKGYYN